MSCYCGSKDCPQCNHEAKKKFWPEKKSPLAGLEKAFKDMTPEEVKQWAKDAAERAKKRREEEERKRNQPPETPTGDCVFCGGLVKGEYVHGLRPGVDHRFVPIGPGSRAYYGWQFKGYHCAQCGLSYKFPPPKGIVTRKGDVDEAQPAAPVDQGRDRNRARRGRKGKQGTA